MKNVGNSNRRRSQAVPKIFRAPIYRAHCAVIFATAQLSCSRFHCCGRHGIRPKNRAQDRDKIRLGIGIARLGLGLVIVIGLGLSWTETSSFE